ncbi:hypothetical protein LWE61_11585 [Sphingobium sufflavum]|uniref:hypothetical protein n=1 Tax=Sphingobium sufflavum TaxID=1129547 RepID=UPI001F3FCDC1|nr:hypothetical protein [Sphingobium sufflavum]MCE7797200.1 hypothetical protein [Sphingobium sufflavum]
MDVTYEKMSGSLGSLLLLWAAIERSAREEIIHVHGCLPKSAYGIAAVLRTWESMVTARQPVVPLRLLLAATLRAQLEGALTLRNGICHGLNGISSAHGDTPATVQWEMNGAKQSMSWDDLQASLGWLSKVPAAIAIISDRSSLETGLLDTIENRRWWRVEFALDVPEG